MPYTFLFIPMSDSDQIARRLSYQHTSPCYASEYYKVHLPDMLKILLLLSSHFLVPSYKDLKNEATYADRVRIHVQFISGIAHT